MPLQLTHARAKATPAPSRSPVSFGLSRTTRMNALPQRHAPWSRADATRARILAGRTEGLPVPRERPNGLRRLGHECRSPPVSSRPRTRARRRAARRRSASYSSLRAPRRRPPLRALPRMRHRRALRVRMRDMPSVNAAEDVRWCRALGSKRVMAHAFRLERVTATLAIRALCLTAERGDLASSAVPRCKRCLSAAGDPSQGG